jgi:DnaJ family protein B protein 6
MYLDFYVFIFWKCFRVFENGRETVMTYENDVLTSKIVNGVNQSITSS